jgi:hypothetical protein
MKKLLGIMVVGGLLLASCDKAQQVQIEKKVNPTAQAAGGSNACSVDDPGAGSRINCGTLRFSPGNPDLPHSICESVTVTEPTAITVQLEDCCLACDLYHVYIDDCLALTVNTGSGSESVGGCYSATVNVPAGTHEICYVHVSSSCEGGANYWSSYSTAPASTLTVGECETDIPNWGLCDGGSWTSFSSIIAACCEDADNHGQFVSCVTQAANMWKAAGLITGAQKGQITSCAADWWPCGE